MSVELSPFSFDRMERAVEKVRDRLLRASSALNSAAIPYAVVGGNAVAAWVSRVDEAAVRNTRDVDILIRREDLDQCRVALELAGFVYRHVASVDLFLDGPLAKARDAIHIVFAGERVRPDEVSPNPDVTDSVDAGPYRIISLEALARVKLTAFRDKDRMHLRDLIDVGLLDETSYARLDPALAVRLRSLLDDPGG